MRKEEKRIDPFSLYSIRNCCAIKPSWRMVKELTANLKLL